MIDLMIARACSGEVVVGEFWNAARRGPAAFDPHTFRIAGAFADPYGLRWS